MVFTVISVAPGLSHEDHRRAVECGPEFIVSETDYPTLLAQTGWIVVDCLSDSAFPRGAVPSRSAGVLAFGPDNVLFVGDIRGAAIHAFALRATDVTSQADVELGNFHNFEGRDLVRSLDQKLAALFGTTSTRSSSTTWLCISPRSRSSSRSNAAEARTRFRRS